VIFESFLKAKIFHDNNKNVVWKLHDITRKILHFVYHFLNFVFKENLFAVLEEAFNLSDAFFFTLVQNIDVKELDDFVSPLIWVINC
jgi:hypothetical protein